MVKKILSFILIFIASNVYAANVAINDQTELAEAPAENDILPLYDTDATAGKRITALHFLEALESALTDFAIHPDNLPDLSATYEPADATILKEADIGTKVLAPNGDGSGLSGVVTAEVDSAVGAVTGVVKSDGSNNFSAADIDDIAPTQTGNSGKYLTTDGTNASWGALTKAQLDAITKPDLTFSVSAPHDLTSRDFHPFYYNDTGASVTIHGRILCTAVGASISVTISEITSRADMTILNATEAIAINTAGTGRYYKTVENVDIDDKVIENEHGLSWDFDDTSEPDSVQCTFEEVY
jgi:hypothetical protein